MTKKEALRKLQRYCAYQERCHQEVRTKLLSLKIYGDELEEIISQLISDDFLNEERFAEIYAGGKMRIKKWGKQKIKSKLKSKKVSNYSINKALKNLDAIQYEENLEQLIEKKYELLSSKSEDQYLIRKKLFNFVYQKGYESTLINNKLAKWFS